MTRICSATQLNNFFSEWKPICQCCQVIVGDIATILPFKLRLKGNTMFQKSDSNLIVLLYDVDLFDVNIL